MFKRLTLASWRQFGFVEIEFHPNLTILTGANGSGKTTILNLLAQHYEWVIPLIAMPWRNPDTGHVEFRPEKRGELGDDDWRWNASMGGVPETLARTVIGRIELGNSKPAFNLTIPQAIQPSPMPGSYQVGGGPQVFGLHVASHRPAYSYRQIAQLPTSVRDFTQTYQRYLGVIRSHYLGHQQHESPNQILKETLISLAMYGEGNSFVEPVPVAAAAYNRFVEILRNILPPSIGFRGLRVRMPEIVMETDTGEFSLDAVSGGISAIIDLGWRIFLYSEMKGPNTSFVVSIDEPENHLHPEMQQSLLPNFVKAFPAVQFIVATHSPFIISSLPESNVYALTYDNHKVRSVMLSEYDKAGSANDVLREVLGLPFTMPLWADKRLQEVIGRYAAREVSDASLAEMRRELDQAGLSDYAPRAVADILARVPG